MFIYKINYHIYYMCPITVAARNIARNRGRMLAIRLVAVRLPRAISAFSRSRSQRMIPREDLSVALPGTHRMPSRKISISGPQAARNAPRKNTCIVFMPAFVNGIPGHPFARPSVLLPDWARAPYYPSFTNTKLSGIKGALDTVGATTSRGGGS